MSHELTRRSVFKILTVIVFASLLTSSLGASGVLTASAQQAGTDTPPVEPTGTSTEENLTSTTTSVAETPTPVPPGTATATTESTLLLAPLTSEGAAQTRHYAKPGAPANEDCSDWDHACALQTALTWPTDWGGSQEIWAAAGVYTPTTNVNNRDATFEINSGNDGVVLYGGFVGTETLLSQRNPYLHPTVLSGDIAHDDGNTNGDYRDISGDNSYHVVKVDSGRSATLDGFTIAAGKADRGNAADSDQNEGGGLYSAGSVTLNDVTFRGNWARLGGGLENAFPYTATLTNVTFVGNYAKNDGGGMHNCAGSIPVVTNATFAFNVAGDNGGAIANGSSITCGSLNGNPAGGIGNGSKFTNVTVSENSADYGEGVSNLTSSPQIFDSIFWGDGGTEFYNSASYPTIVDSIIEGGCPSDSLGPCINVIDSDPFLGSLTNNGGNTKTMAIGAGGAATDAGGVNSACPPPATDQRGVTRPQGAACDIGAVEGEFLSISGTVYGLSNPADRPNVTLSYNDGGARTAHPDTTGAYSIAIPSGWSGTVTPSLSGYVFTPPSRDYTNVTTSQTGEDYTAVILYAVSGTVTGLSSSEVVNVDLDYSIDSGSTVTIHPSSTGYYSIWVPDGSDILITPTLTGYSFTPASRHPTVTSDLPNRDFAATSLTKTISGTVSGPASLDLTSVDLNYFDGFWKVVHPNSSGAYTITIPTGWTGTVTPARTGYAFSPGNRFYTPVTANVTSQDYTAIEAPFTISGNAGHAGVTLSYDVAGPQTATADGGGLYSIEVPPGWTGTVMPSLTGYVFNPGSITYTNVYTDWPNQNYTANLALGPKADFDGDGKTDPSLFAKATGNWFSIGSTSGFLTPALALGNDSGYITVPGDYDGDGKADAAVFEKATGNWFVVGSTAGFFMPALNFGNATDYIPVPADYDGDGKTDPAVFEKSTGNWFVIGSSAGFFTPALNFGNGSNFIPVPGDYDGDGKADPAVFEKSTGNWFAVGSTSGFMVPALGLGNATNYIPVPGDYDGDGRMDAAVFEKATGNWFAVGSTSGFITPALGFGNGTDYLPQPSDYDGDGRTDAAVFEKATGNWFVVGSASGFFMPALGFGNADYIPVVK